MADQLTKRKQVANDTPWPDHWTVRFSWESPFGMMHNKLQEFQVQGDRTWYTFIKHVHNRVNDRCWIDAVCETGFRAFYPEKVVRIRDRKSDNAGKRIQPVARRRGKNQANTVGTPKTT